MFCIIQKWCVLVFGFLSKILHCSTKTDGKRLGWKNELLHILFSTAKDQSKPVQFQHQIQLVKISAIIIAEKHRAYLNVYKSILVFFQNLLDKYIVFINYCGYSFFSLKGQYDLSKQKAIFLNTFIMNFYTNGRVSFPNHLHNL